MELDAIVDTTENATNTIMEACEAIQENLAGKPLEETAYIDSQLIRIVEACTFQDLTGQRISKISKFLKQTQVVLVFAHGVFRSYFQQFEIQHFFGIKPKLRTSNN